MGKCFLGFFFADLMSNIGDSSELESNLLTCRSSTILFLQHSVEHPAALKSGLNLPKSVTLEFGQEEKKSMCCDSAFKQN